MITLPEPAADAPKILLVIAGYDVQGEVDVDEADRIAGHQLGFCMRHLVGGD